MLLDDPCELNFTFGHGNHIIGNNYKTIADQQIAYDEITPVMLRDAMRVVFAPENLTVAVKGKKRKIDKDKLENILREYR